MTNVTANGIQIEYDSFGDPESPPLLLIAGLGRQLVFWDEEFCRNLAERGLYVIRFDNRDTGLSTKFEASGVPDITALYDALTQGETVEVPYTLDDMADDAAGLLDALGIEKAHICGVSMGAAITQTIGYRHPGRALSLIPVMGTTGNPELPPPSQEAMDWLLTPAPEERTAYIEYTMKLWRVFWGSLSFDEEDVRQKAALEYDRCFYPQGLTRQMAAILAHGNRKPMLASINAPTLVIHGSEDPIIPVEGGRDTAEAIDGAQIRIIEGMGHSLPRDVWPKIVDSIAWNTAQTRTG
ncbi:MAG: alpha/beta fold hydrolase [Desulfosalsimonas sp.]